MEKFKRVSDKNPENKPLVVKSDNKPMGIKSYGSIPHMIGSLMGKGDKRLDKKQNDIIYNPRKGDLVIAQEKLDGSCVSVYKDDRGHLHALGRAGFLASTSPYKQHHIFDKWVKKNSQRFHDLLSCGERVVGEWLIQVHGTKIYLIHEPFVAFDIMVGHIRKPYLQFVRQNIDSDGNKLFKTPYFFEKIKIKSESRIIDLLGLPSDHGQERVEGLVIRVETDCPKRGRFVNFLAKYVRHDYEAGKYMKEEIFNDGYEDFL